MALQRSRLPRLRKVWLVRGKNPRTVHKIGGTTLAEEFAISLGFNLSNPKDSKVKLLLATLLIFSSSGSGYAGTLTKAEALCVASALTDSEFPALRTIREARAACKGIEEGESICVVGALRSKGQRVPRSVQGARKACGEDGI